MKKYLFFDPEKCSACGACALACMDQNDVDIPGGEQPFRHTFVLEKEQHLSFYSVSCKHCDDAPCVMGCPCWPGETCTIPRMPVRTPLSSIAAGMHRTAFACR